jgi:inward rectifier potassium channel
MGMTHRQADSVQFRVGKAELTMLGAKRYDLSDPYHLAITMRWPTFFLSYFAIDLVVNLVFALLYHLVPHCIANVRPGSLSDALFFSMETLATVGYGVMAPSTTYGHIVASTELTCGLVFTAVFTGLVFVRFSRIKAKIVFAKTAVVVRQRPIPTLMIRMGYKRAGSLADAEAHVTFMRLERLPNGEIFRQSDELKLVRNRMALVVVGVTVMHEIDAESPFHGYTPERLAATDGRLIVTIRARNQAAGAEIFDIGLYHSDDIQFGMRYQDMVHRIENGRIEADMGKLDLIEPEPAPEAAGAVA